MDNFAQFNNTSNIDKSIYNEQIKKMILLDNSLKLNKEEKLQLENNVKNLQNKLGQSTSLIEKMKGMYNYGFIIILFIIILVMIIYMA